MSWSDIKQAIKARKELFANTYNYYSPRQRWGEIYGYNLEEPYTEEELLDYEENILGDKLPKEYHEYLSTVSREVFTNGFPTIFPLEEHEEFCIKDYPEIDVSINNYGNNNYDKMVLKGKDKGTIWSVKDGVVKKIAENFYDYLLTELE